MYNFIYLTRSNLKSTSFHKSDMESGNPTDWRTVWIERISPLLILGNIIAILNFLRLKKPLATTLLSTRTPAVHGPIENIYARTLPCLRTTFINNMIITFIFVIDYYCTIGPTRPHLSSLSDVPRSLGNAFLSHTSELSGDQGIPSRHTAECIGLLPMIILPPLCIGLLLLTLFLARRAQSYLFRYILDRFKQRSHPVVLHILQAVSPLSLSTCGCWRELDLDIMRKEWIMI